MNIQCDTLAEMLEVVEDLIERCIRFDAYAGTFLITIYGKA